MKNIQVIDEAENCVYDIFALPDDEFEIMFPDGQDIEFIEDLYARVPAYILDPILDRLWKHPIWKDQAQGIHAILFYGLYHKKKYYPSKKDRLARNPDGSLLRAQREDN